MSMSVVFRLGIKRSPPIPFRPALELRFLAPFRPEKKILINIYVKMIMVINYVYQGNKVILDGSYCCIEIFLK